MLNCPLKSQGTGLDGVECEGVTCAWYNATFQRCAIALLASLTFKGVFPKKGVSAHEIR